MCFYGRVDGIGRWRTLCARRQGRAGRACAVYLHCRVRRRAHAGKYALADADGKTTAMLPQLSAAGLPFISVLTDPTMGGVSASFAFLGDIVIAEPKALIGFAGPRVIEQTVRETLPEGFQRAEFLLQKGAIDMIIDRRHM